MANETGDTSANRLGWGRAGGFLALVPGFLVAAMIALASQFVSEHYGAPAMLLALLFGIALNFLSAEPRCAPGIGFTSKTLLRAGVALLGVRISADMLADLGWDVIALVVGGVAGTIAFGLVASRLFGYRYRFAFLSAGAVAICGASAAMALAAILPRDEKSDDRLVFTVVGVTVLSTVAMILYPLIASALGFDEVMSGIFIGATVHDVAQVVGAGYSISEPAGDAATLVKLLRVLMLAPVVVLGGLVIRATAGARTGTGPRPPLIPAFVAGFIVLAGLNSFGLLPELVVGPASELSRWLLLVAIAAVGLRTVPGEVLRVGPAAAALIVAETVFLGVVVVAGLHFMVG